MMAWDREGRATRRGVLVDLACEKRLEERLQYRTFHDRLTALPHRRLFHDRVAHALSRPPTGQVAVLFIDLDAPQVVCSSPNQPLGWAGSAGSEARMPC
jgi:PleD family two-component response regulator